MNYKEKILEMLDHITSQTKLQRIYWYVQHIIVRR